MQVTLRQLIHEYEHENRPHVSGPEDIAREAAFISECSKECFVVFYLDCKKKMLAREIVSVGIIDASLIHPREVFRSAVHINAHTIILCHNHPSGNTEFSSADIDVTKLLIQAGEILGIGVVDHVLVAGTSWANMRREHPEYFQGA